jgi:hypothetical protein
MEPHAFVPKVLVEARAVPERSFDPSFDAAEGTVFG